MPCQARVLWGQKPYRVIERRDRGREREESMRKWKEVGRKRQRRGGRGETEIFHPLVGQDESRNKIYSWVFHVGGRTILHCLPGVLIVIWVRWRVAGAWGALQHGVQAS